MLVSSISYFNKKSFNEFLNTNNKNQMNIDNARFGHISEAQISELSEFEKSLQNNIVLSDVDCNINFSQELEKQSLDMIA